MARIFMSGFETRDLLAEGFIMQSGTFIPGNSFSSPRLTANGLGGALCLLTRESTVNGFCNVRAQLPTTYSELFIRFGFNSFGGSRADQGRIVEMTLNGVHIFSLREVDFGSAFVGIRACNGAGTTLAQTGALIDTLNAIWYLIEVRILLAASGGRVQVWVNGTLQLDFTGAVVGPSGETTMNQIVLGKGSPHNAGMSTTLQLRGYDDLAINDTSGSVNNGRPGNGYIVQMLPDGNGGTNQLLNTFGNSTNNYQHLRPGPQNVLSSTNPTYFVGTNTPGNKDLYQMTTVPPDFGGVTAVKPTALAVRNGPAIANIQFKMKPASQLETSTTNTPLPVGGLDWVSRIIEVNPNTSNPYTVAELQDIEAGFSLEV